MAVLLSCPRGHQWEPPSEGPPGGVTARPVCPLCGTPAHTVAPLTPAGSETVDGLTGAYVPADGSSPGETSPYLAPVSASVDAVAESVRGSTVEPAADETVAEPKGPRPRVPGYEILSVLGRGGMGVVYKARQVQLKRLVALKMIRGGAHAGREQLQRFQTEAEAVARLQHPNIVQVYEVGEVREGQPYFSLEYVEGGSLQQKLGQAPQPARAAAQLVVTLARAMHFAHQRGIVHRDLKPANVLLGRDGTPKITDFGLAKQLDIDGGQTQSGAIMGTPSYMAPEQATGQTRDLGPAADVYALGALLYECLTGRPPFRAANLLDTLEQVRHQDPVSPRLLQPATPRDLETICLTCLRKEPARRYASAAALADDLDCFLHGVPIKARPLSIAGRTVKWVRRYPSIAALLALAWLVFLAGMTLVYGQYERATARGEDALIAESAALDEANKAKALGTEADSAGQMARAETSKAEAAWQNASVRLYFNHIALADQAYKANQPAQADDWLDQCPPALCDWEWHYLRRRCHAELLSLPGVQTMTWTPDGGIIAMVPGASLALWDGATGRELRTFRGHNKGVVCLACSPDGSRLATGGQDGLIQLWDVHTGQELRSFPAHANRVHALAFSPDGQRLLSGGSDRKIKVWETASGLGLLSLDGQQESVESVAYSPQGQWIASGGRDRLLRVWDARTGQPLHTLKNQSSIWDMACQPDGRELAVACGAGVNIWDPGSGKFLRHVRSHTLGVLSVAYSRDGQRLAAGGFDGSVHTFHPVTGANAHLHRCYSGGVFRVAISPDGQRLATIGRGGMLKVWREPLDPEPRIIGRHDGQATAVAWHPSGRSFASAAADDTIKLWDAATLRELCTLTGHKHVVSSLAYSADGKRLLSGSWDQTIKLWDLRTRRVVRTFAGQGADVEWVAFSADGKRIASAHSSIDPAVKVWDVASGQILWTLNGQRRVAFSGDGKYLASFQIRADRGTTNFLYDVTLWDAATGQPVRTLAGPPHSIHGLAFSPDSRRLASVGGEFSMGTEVYLWDVSTGAELLAVKAQGQAGMCLAFSPDGKRLAIGSVDHSLSIWDSDTGQELVRLPGHLNVILGVAWSPDGQRVLTASADRTIRLWDGSPSATPRTLRGHTNYVTAGQFSPAGQLLATAERNRNVKLWDTTTWQVTHTLLGSRSSVRQLAFSADGRLLAAGSYDKTVHLWDVVPANPQPESGRKRGPRVEERLVYRGHDAGVLSLAISPDSRHMASGDEKGTVRVWDAHSGRDVVAFAGAKSYVLSVAYSPDGRRLAVAGSEPEVAIHDSATGERLQVLRGHTGLLVNYVAFSPDGQQLASAGGDAALRVWDLAGGRTIFTCQLNGPVYTVAYSPDGDRLATGDSTGIAKLWDARNGTLLRTFSGHTREVVSVTFSPDGRHLASCSYDETVKIWDLAKEDR